jgi:VNT family MFS transporter (synaptic vesicle glycoprotein 2)
VPSFIVGVLLFYLPESPKFLLSQGKHDEAMCIFRGIFVTNTGKPKELYPVKELLVTNNLKEELECSGQKAHGKYKTMLIDVLDNTKQLFQRPILKFTIISVTINFTFHIGYYGLMMWFPELFNRFDEYFSESLAFLSEN